MMPYVTKSATGSVSLNAAFLQEIKDDNHELSMLLWRVQRIVLEPRGLRTAANDLADAARQLRDQLSFHFALEEAFGYFDDALDVPPQHCEAAMNLRKEHEQLFERVVAIADDADGLLHRKFSRATLRRIAKRLRRFCGDLRQHEIREGDLIIESLYSDIGECD